MTKNLANNIIPIFILMVLVGGAFFMGSLWEQLQIIRGGANSGTNKNLGAAPSVPNNEGAQPSQATGKVELTDNDHIKGDSNAKIAMIEYSDYECPFCKTFHPTAQQALDEYDGDVMWVFRHYPLVDIHPGAQKKAEAAECIDKLGGNDAFWSFTDSVFENQSVTVEELTEIAAQLVPNISDFETCLNSDEMAAAVSSQEQSGVSAGVRGTPGTILLNIETGETQLISGALPFAQIKQAIDSML